MSKNKLLIIVVSLFLVHSQLSAATDVGTSSINLTKKVSPTNTNIKEMFATEFNVLAFALGMYYLDTEEHLSKEGIKEKLLQSHAILEEKFRVIFDLDNIDLEKNGFTRYYPFVMNEKDYMIRIFDADEKHYLEKTRVYHEGIFEDSEIGFQIIPGINSMLEERKPEKVELLDPTICSKQP